MTDFEFEVLDELYFVTSFNDVVKQLEQVDQQELEAVLKAMQSKGWVKVFDSIDAVKEVVLTEETSINRCFFLATKKGLLEHNLR
jgi:hypothetical protein